MVDLIAELCGVLTGDAGPTDAYAARRFTWRLGDGGTGDGRLGTLQITVRPRGRRAAEDDEYAVEEQPLVGRMGRMFLLVNLTDPEQEDVYECVVGPVSSCTCKAGRVGRHECKHVATIRELARLGGLPPAPAGDPEPPVRLSEPCPF